MEELVNTMYVLYIVFTNSSMYDQNFRKILNDVGLASLGYWTISKTVAQLTSKVFAKIWLKFIVLFYYWEVSFTTLIFLYSF